MLYDVHTHIGLDQGFVLRGWWPYAATAQDLLQLMDLHGIDRGVCFPFVLSSAFDPYAFADRQRVELLPGRFPYDRENALLVQEVSRIDTDERLSVLAMFDPSREIAKQVANLEKLAPRITGLKVQATVLESPIATLLEEGKPILQLAEQHRWPVLIHTSVHPADPWSPVRDCIDVAVAFPKARFNLAHSLRFSLPHLKEVKSIPNVWVDCAAHLNHCALAREESPAVALKKDRIDADYTNPTKALEAVHAVLGNRYMWGSDNPFQSWCDDSIKLVHAYKQEADALHALPASVKHDIATVGPEAWLLDK